MVTLPQIEQQAASYGLILRLKVKHYINLWTFSVIVARPREGQSAILLGQLKGWAYNTNQGLHLDTLRIQGEYINGVGSLLWGATFAWALTHTPCSSAHLLAISDEIKQHKKLVRYFKRIGFQGKRVLKGNLIDLPLRLIWGGSGLIMKGDCKVGLIHCNHWLFNKNSVSISM
uniref:Uncharacterized protein n=1 Tax=Paulinella longichromatophora TaxID=1708747 RepID=A0A2H4ZQ96_9EUKA|nr:hypothetical protein PLO_742 [Paulinella longichromatophora]